MGGKGRGSSKTGGKGRGSTGIIVSIGGLFTGKGGLIPPVRRWSALGGVGIIVPGLAIIGPEPPGLG
jgi:hypothetical protein